MKHTAFDLMLRYQKLATQRMRDHLNELEADEGVDEDVFNIENAQYAKMIQILRILDPECPEWPQKDGKCQVIDLESEKIRRRDMRRP